MSVSVYKKGGVRNKLELMEKEGRRRVEKIQIVEITKKKIEKINKGINYVHAASNSIKLKQHRHLITQKANKIDMI